MDTLFAECLTRAEAVLEHLPEPAEPTPAPDVHAAKRWGWLAITSALLLAGLLGIGVWMWIESRRTTPPGDLKRYFSIAPNTAVNVCADSFDLVRAGGVVSAAFAAGGDTISTPLGAYRLLPGGCLSATAGDSLGQDSLRVLLRNTSGQTVALDYFPTVRRPSTVYRPPSTVTYRFYEREVPEPEDIRRLAIDVPTGWEAEFLRYLPWLKGLFLLLLGLLLYALLRRRARRRQKLVAETQHGDRPPYTWTISIRDLEPPDPGENFPIVLNRLRRRTTDDWLELDLRATVQATIAQAGRIDFRFQQQTKPPEYLLLIDRRDAADHRARLFDELYQRFRANDVLIERFFYDGDPRLCFNEQYPGGLQLNELYHQYPESRLLLIGAGHTLLNPLNLKLSRWAEALARWRQRSLFSPRPPGEWGRREQVLGELLPVLPASLRAFWYAVEQFDAGEDADFGRWGDAVTDAPPAPVEPDPQNLIASLQRHYSDDLLQWIAACAVYPSLHYDLTIYLWQVLFPGARVSLTSTVQDKTATTATLSALTALPWFTKGSIPDPARAELLHWFEQNHPEQHRRVRLALAEQLALPHNQPPLDSAAWDQYRMNAALNEWRLTDDRKKKKNLEREIEELLKYTEADFTVIHYLNKPKNPLQFEVPERWKKILYRSGRPGLGLRDFWRDLFGWALWIWVAAAAALGWYQPKTEECSGEQVLYVQEGETLTLCLRSPEDYALYLEYKARAIASWKPALKFWICWKAKPSPG
ncbi:MAG: hypothetical protein IPJ82_11740 [Lewinellaceae bacterium]|nr:hypothetical protein [Lewinellaceae bacterium]